PQQRRSLCRALRFALGALTRQRRRNAWRPGTNYQYLMVASQGHPDSAEQWLQMVGELQQVDQQDEQFIVPPFADSPGESLGQDGDLAGRGKQVAAATVVERQRIRLPMLRQKTLHRETEPLVALEKDSDASGGQAVAFGEDGSQALPPPR